MEMKLRGWVLGYTLDEKREEKRTLTVDLIADVTEKLSCTRRLDRGNNFWVVHLSSQRLEQGSFFELLSKVLHIGDVQSLIVIIYSYLAKI